MSDTQNSEPVIKIENLSIQMSLADMPSAMYLQT